MRLLFAATCLVALVCSGIGLWGVHRYQVRDVEEALAALPGSGQRGVAESGGLALEVLLGVTQGVPGSATDPPPGGRGQVTGRASRHLARLEALGEAYRWFRRLRFSPDVDRLVDRQCDEAALANPDRCVTRVRHALLRLRADRDTARRGFELILLGSRSLWVFAFVVGLILTYRAYSQVRLESRRASEPAT